MNEEDEGFADWVAQKASEATHEAFLKALEVSGEQGVLIGKKGTLYRVYKDENGIREEEVE